MTTKNPTVTSFCQENDACEPGWQWASHTGCKTMAQLWARTDMLPEWRIWIATCDNVCGDVDMRLFACWCATRIPAPSGGRESVAAAIRLALGLMTAAQLKAIHAANGYRGDAYDFSDAASTYRVCAARLANYAAQYAAYYALHATPASRRKAHLRAQAKQLILLVGNPFKETK